MPKIDILKALKTQGIEVEEGQEKFLNEVSNAIEKAMETNNEDFDKAFKSVIDERLGQAQKDEAGNTISLMTMLKEVQESMEKLTNKNTLSLSDRVDSSG